MPNNFKPVEPGSLYRSGRINPNELRMLSSAPYNIRKIISLDRDTGMFIAPYMQKYGIEHVYMPIMLGGDIRTPARTIADNAASLFKSNQGAVLVHCALGRDRTGFAIAIHNAVINGRACDVAIKEQEALGYGAGLSPQAKAQFNAEICKRCKVAHTHYCETENEQGEEVISGIYLYTTENDVEKNAYSFTVIKK